MLGMSEAPSEHPPLTILGWREWVRFPDLILPPIKAKVDTGARSSAMHATEIETFERSGETYCRFLAHPSQRDPLLTERIEVPLVDQRRVRSSSGEEERRCVVRLRIEVAGRTIDMEATLTERDQMGFRMLLGRTALRGNFLVDSDQSFLGGRLKSFKRRVPKGAERPLG